jgi:hypothetical protein
MKGIKTFCSTLAVICLLIAIPTAAFGQTNNLPLKSLTKKMTPSTYSKAPLKSQTESYQNAGDYPLVTDGQYVDTLYDTYYTSHTITFGSIQNYSSTTMDIQIYDSSDYAYFKDEYTQVEFYKNSGGTLVYDGVTQFDTLGSYNSLLHSTVPKADFSDQQYIYLRVGMMDSLYDTYYSDTTYFKVKNPYYNPPIIDTTPPNKPTVYDISNKDTTVRGNAEPYSTVYGQAGTAKIGSGKADSSGNFSFGITAQKAGTTLTFYAQDSAGNKSGTVSKKVLDKIAPSQPAVNSIGDNQTIVIGKTEAGANVIIKAGSSVIGQGTAYSTGSFIIKIKSVQKANTTLTIYATDSAGNQSTGTSVKVADKTPPVTPTVNKVTSYSTQVTGKAESGSTIYVFNGTTLIGKATTDQIGTFSASIKAQPKGATLEIASMDAAGNQSKTILVHVY